MGSLSVAPPQVPNPMSALAIPGQQSGRDYHQWPLAPILPLLLQGTVLLEYFTGEKPLRMRPKQAENLTLCNLTIVFWQGSCVIY